MSNIEEGTPLIAEVPVVEQPKRRGIIAAFALTAIAATGALAYTSGASAGFAGLPKTTNLAKLSQMHLKDSGSKGMKFASTTNLASKESIVSYELSKYYPYLEGEKTSISISELSEIESKWNIEIDFFNGVSKVSNDGKKKVRLGHITGLSREANLVAVDGEYCANGNGPFHSHIPVVCNEEFVITQLEQKSPCWYVVTVGHPKFCVNPVKTVGTWPEQMAAEERVDKVYETAK